MNKKVNKKLNQQLYKESSNISTGENDIKMSLGDTLGKIKELKAKF